MLKLNLFILQALLLSSHAYSKPWSKDRDFFKSFESKTERSYEKVNWVGYIEGNSKHTTNHNHEISFTQQSTGQSFDIINSPKLEKAHCSSEKNLLVEIEGEKTPRFLFWGNNLIIKKFTVLKELEKTPHKKHKERESKDLWDRPNHREL